LAVGVCNSPIVCGLAATKDVAVEQRGDLEVSLLGDLEYLPHTKPSRPNSAAKASEDAAVERLGGHLTGSPPAIAANTEMFRILL